MSTYPWINDASNVGGPSGYLAITSPNGLYLATGANSIVSANNQDINIIVNSTTGNINLLTNGGALQLYNNGAIGIGNPADFGTSGEVLTSQGSGALPIWSSPVPSGFTYKEVLKYSAPGTFSINLLTSYPNARMFVFTTVGGGGGGGGSATTGASQISFGMGGGGGALSTQNRTGLTGGAGKNGICLVEIWE